ncbi:uncharacterized protein LOC121235359 [Juglans microcarpa x Juglans regia]|uniref:uncharacterized protein LOC121235359 n=1 Tax=Juglans microcarpa x Juglans regia TaxID=2249226 RepID=UPI001B7ED415|nr:uncharacterized protein LOC121235359 [Juglans microcarpa x Juglans regia]
MWEYGCVLLPLHFGTWEFKLFIALCLLIILKIWGCLVLGLKLSNVSKNYFPKQSTKKLQNLPPSPPKESSEHQTVAKFQKNLICEATTFLLDVLKPNLPEHSFLQTKSLSAMSTSGSSFAHHFDAKMKG